MHVAFTRQIDAMVTDEAQTLLYEYRPDEPERARQCDRPARAPRPRRQALLCGVRAGRPPRHGLAQRGHARARHARHPVRRSDREGPTRRAGWPIDLPDHRRLVVAADREWIERIDRTVLGTFAVGFVGPDRPRDWRRADARRLFAAAAESDRQRRRRRSSEAISAAGCRSAIATTNSTSWPGC